MNSTLTRTTSAELNIYSSVHAELPSDTISEHNAYATAPMAAVLPPYQPPSEEELHTSFEKAISKRSGALYGGRLSYPALPAQNTSANDRITYPHTTHNTMVTCKQKRPQLLPSSAWQRGVVLVSLALTFMLVGFDLMGLLILHMH